MPNDWGRSSHVLEGRETRAKAAGAEKIILSKKGYKESFHHFLYGFHGLELIDIL